MEPYRIIAREAQRDILGEGLLWSPRDNAVYWTDILAPALNRFSLTDGRVTRWDMPDYIGWVIERRDRPGFIAGFKSGFAELELDPVRVRHLAAPEPHLSDNRLNDAKADSRGRIWAGTMSMAEKQPLGSLYRFDPGGALTHMGGDYIVCNGPALSPDERFFYHTDSIKRLVYRFAMDAGGGLGPREDFIRFPPDWGYPDGMTTDVDGHLWIGHWGGARLSRFTPEGRLDRSIELPASQITNVCFAGAKLDRMFVTSAARNKPDESYAGCLFEILDPGIVGLPPGQFAG
ncbi:MAG TPA: SMP-30/gluconolactonase/LRE family protein [Rhizomicrobium sp.]|jgi:sugar lactone lactonase YvrE|nr:SMP-30/gluconolactonase/LRE family protein [Rhizomicrobium sp.]